MKKLLLFILLFVTVANAAPSGWSPLQHNRYTTNTDDSLVNGGKLINLQWSSVTGFTNTSFVLATNGTATLLTLTNTKSIHFPGSWRITTNGSNPDLQITAPDNVSGAILRLDGGYIHC